MSTYRALQDRLETAARRVEEAWSAVLRSRWGDAAEDAMTAYRRAVADGIDAQCRMLVAEIERWLSDDCRPT